MLYPQLWTPKEGDQIRIINPLDANKNPRANWHYGVGDIGTITSDVETDLFDELYMISINGLLIGVFREEFEYHSEQVH
jgi:hypothetical protein